MARCYPKQEASVAPLHSLTVSVAYASVPRAWNRELSGGEATSASAGRCGWPFAVKGPRMDSRRFDEWTRTLGRSGTRRGFLLASGSVIAGIALTRSADRTRAQSSGCMESSECPEGQICVDGFCFFPECWPEGSACSSHDDCCDILLCFSGVCATAPTCGLEGAGCGGDGDCCPGLICPAGTCAPEPLAPPVDSGGDGGNEQPAPTNTGEPAAGSVSTSGGTTSAGVSVLALPNTGVGAGQSSRVSSWLAPGAIATAIMALRKARSIRDERI